MIAVRDLSHDYGKRAALNEVSFEVGAGEIFGLVGPNGGGKTTLLRILCTLLRPRSGRVEVNGVDVVRDPFAARRSMGVVFQSPALDQHLTIAENLTIQGPMHGVTGVALKSRIRELLAAFGLEDRAGERTGRLSGGTRRRVEIAKSLIHKPRLLVLDEPSTGLDPAARADLWAVLKRSRETEGTTVLLTTHMMDEAGKCDRVGMLDAGRLVAIGAPPALSAEVGGDVLVIETDDPAGLGRAIDEKFGAKAQVVDGYVRMEQPAGHTFIPQLVEGLPGRVRSVSLRKPTLEDVFVRRTGKAYRHES
ncbi:MAG: ABC transporter ATP-binding protein [Nitrospirae bacterium]|nr:ABC transporter ATP-binding protein [Nitrospirota bacterium]